MKRALLLTFFVVISGHAYAEWIEVGSAKIQGGYAAYADPDSIRRKRNLVKMWQVYDYKTVQTGLAGKSYWSAKGLDEFDCTEEQIRTIAFYFYSGQMGTGEIIYSDTDSGKWEPVIPDSIGHLMWKLACGNK